MEGIVIISNLTNEKWGFRAEMNFNRQFQKLTIRDPCLANTQQRIVGYW